MGLPAKKYENVQSFMRLEKNDKAKKNNSLKIVVVLLFVVAIVTIGYIFLNSLVEKTTTEILAESGIDWNNPPCSPNDLSDDWAEVTPEIMKQNSNRSEYQNKNTGLKIAFDKGIYGKPRFSGKDHWHIYNPFSVSIKDYYLDKQGNTIHKNDGNSHIEIKCN